MNYSLLCIAGIALLFFSCRSKSKDMHPENAGQAGADTTQAAQPYFPVAAFLKNEMNYVDSLPVGIKKYTTSGKRKDSGYIKSAEFDKLAAEFSSPELNDSSFRENFAESSFFDRSTNYATFFYKAKNPELSVQRVDVITARGEVYDEVKSVYIEKNVREGDTFIRKKLFWKPKRNFQIITVGSDASSDKAELLKVVWDNRED